MSGVPETVDIDHLRQWIGRQDIASEVLSPELVRRFRTTLELPGATNTGCLLYTSDAADDSLRV